MSRTINPLHFEDLEPKRFEDLVRQLAYDYRIWSDIEATGRSGGDGGFDIRAWEKVAQTDDDADSPSDRQWLIQCKREQVIGPTKAGAYAKEIVENNPGLYGVLFVTSSVLSKKARDAIREEFAKGGVQEIHIWTRSELEDQLFQPKNDHLLFAYFGYSLLRKRVTVKTRVKSILAIKRKLHKILGEHPYGDIMIRDAAFESYPETDKYDSKPNDDPPVIFGRVHGYYYGGLVVILERYNAYYDREKKEYDYDDRYNQIHLSTSAFEDLYRAKEPKNRVAFVTFHRSIDDKHRYHYVKVAAIPYESIVDIDDTGDEFFDGNHLFVLRDSDGTLFRRPRTEFIHKDGNYHNLMNLDKKVKRIKYFPTAYRSRKPKQEPEMKTPRAVNNGIEKPFPGLNPGKN